MQQPVKQTAPPLQANSNSSSVVKPAVHAPAPANILDLGNDELINLNFMVSAKIEDHPAPTGGGVQKSTIYIKMHGEQQLRMITGSTSAMRGEDWNSQSRSRWAEFCRIAGAKRL